MGTAKVIPWHEWTGIVESAVKTHAPLERRSSLDLAIIILNYNTCSLLRSCLDSVLAAEGDCTYTVCVVDNASSDGSVEMVRAEYPEVDVIANRRNGGYSAGNNLAMRWYGFEPQFADSAGWESDSADTGESTAAWRLPRYVLLLNPDTRVPPNTFAEMLNFMDENPEVGVAGPRVRRLDGTLDRACRRSFPTPKTSFYRMTGVSRLFPKSRVFNSYNLEYLPETAVHPVDSVVGAYMQVRREAILQVGLLDEAYFMYGEDLDWAKRIKDAGWQVWYNGQSEISHVKEASSRRSRKARLAFYEAMWIFYRKHYRSQTPWLLDKLILLGIMLKGGAGVAARMWQLRGQRNLQPQR